MDMDTEHVAEASSLPSALKLGLPRAPGVGACFATTLRSHSPCLPYSDDTNLDDTEHGY